MRLEQLNAEIKESALSVDGVNTATMDWVHTINDDNGTEYDKFLWMPPRRIRNINTDTNSKEWLLEYYLFRQNNDGQGNPVNTEERDIIWSELEIEADLIINTLFNRDRLRTKWDALKVMAISPHEITFDEGNLGNDGLIWVKGSVKLKTLNDC